MATGFTTLHINDALNVQAPDGSSVHVLPALAGGSMARFRLEPGAVARAVLHRTVEEIWYIMTGTGRMWRSDGQYEEITDLVAGTSLTIPVGCSFQFRCDGNTALEAIAITMPPWPGEEEAIFTQGVWPPTLS